METSNDKRNSNNKTHPQHSIKARAYKDKKKLTIKRKETKNPKRSTPRNSPLPKTRNGQQSKRSDIKERASRNKKKGSKEFGFRCFGTFYGVG